MRRAEAFALLGSEGALDEWRAFLMVSLLEPRS